MSVFICSTPLCRCQRPDGPTLFDRSRAPLHGLIPDLQSARSESFSRSAVNGNERPSSFFVVCTSRSIPSGLTRGLKHLGCASATTESAAVGRLLGCHI